MFCLIYACLSNITPPVAMSAYVASGIAGSDQTKTGLMAVRLGLIGFIIPFFFWIIPFFSSVSIRRRPQWKPFGLFSARRWGRLPSSAHWKAGFYASADGRNGLYFSLLRRFSFSRNDDRLCRICRDCRGYRIPVPAAEKRNLISPDTGVYL